MATRRPRRSEALHTTHRRKFKRHTSRRSHLGDRPRPDHAGGGKAVSPTARSRWLAEYGHVSLSELGDPRDQVVALSAACIRAKP